MEQPQSAVVIGRLLELFPKPGWFRKKLSEKPVKAQFFHYIQGSCSKN
jgi:hypothetical protein